MKKRGMTKESKTTNNVLEWRLRQHNLYYVCVNHAKLATGLKAPPLNTIFDFFSFIFKCNI